MACEGQTCQVGRRGLGLGREGVKGRFTGLWLRKTMLWLLCLMTKYSRKLQNSGVNYCLRSSLCNVYCYAMPY